MQQYDKPVSGNELKDSLKNTVSDTALEAINKVLKLDKKDVVVKGETLTPEDGKTTISLDKKDQAALLKIDGQAGETVTLDIDPSIKTKLFVFDTDADLVTGFKATKSVIVAGDGNNEITLTGSKNTVESGSGDDVIKTGNGKDSISGGLGNDTLEGGNGKDTYSWSNATMGAGEKNVVIDGKGSQINLTDAINALKIGGQALESVNKGKVAVGSTIDANNSVAFVTEGDKQFLQVDLNGDGKFNADQDFQIEIVGTNTIKGVVFNAKTDTFDLI